MLSSVVQVERHESSLTDARDATNILRLYRLGAFGQSFFESCSVFPCKSRFAPRDIGFSLLAIARA